MDCKGIDGVLTYEEEFKLAIQSIPFQELWLPLWDIAIMAGKVVLLLKQPLANRAELVQYLRIVVDFAKRY